MLCAQKLSSQTIVCNFASSTKSNNMKIGNLRKTTGVWKSLFFMGNVCKMRQALISYLLGEGVEAKVEDGQVIFEFNESIFVVDFEMNDNYSECTINYKCEDEDYQKLNMSDKTFIADKVNTEHENHAMVYTFNDSFVIHTYFYFCNKQMMLELFRSHFHDMTESLELTINIVTDKIEEKKNRTRRIGFFTQAEEQNNSESNALEVAASL